MKGLIFTYTLTYGGAVIGLFQPFVGLLIYISFAILRPELLWNWSVPQGNYSRIVAIGFLLGWMFRGFGTWKLGQAKGVVYAFLGLLAWTVCSAAFIAEQKEEAWRFVEVLAKIVLPFFVGITLVDSVSRLKTIAWVIMLSQAYLALEFNQSYLEGYNRLQIEGFGGMDNNCNAIALVSCLGLALFLGMASSSWWLKAVAAGSGALMGHAILISFSRGGMLASVFTGVVAFWLIPKRAIHYLGAIIVVALVLRFAGPAVVERFSTTFVDESVRDRSAQSRLELWSACLDSMKKHPLGIGPGNWAGVAESYGFDRGRLAHSLWLQIGAELGLPGLTLLLLFYGLCIIKLWPWTRQRSPLPDPWIQQIARMVITCLIGFTVSAQFVSLDLLEQPYYITLIGAGLLKIGANVAAPRDIRQPSNRPVFSQPRYFYSRLGARRIGKQVLPRPLIILGTGGSAYDVLDIVEGINAVAPTWEVAGFLDDFPTQGRRHLEWEVLGPIRDARRFGGASFINAIGSDRSYQRRPDILASTGLDRAQFATLIHPQASVSRRAKLGLGTYVNFGASIAGGVTVGDHVSVGPGCIIGHDTVVEEYAMVAPAAVVSGFVRLGKCCYVGAGATLRQRVHIGDRALVGMGAVVLNDVEEGDIVVGNPARSLHLRKPTEKLTHA